MNLRRLRAGECIAALGGVALLGSLFMSWYEGASAWEAFAVNDMLLAAAALLAISLVPVTATQRVPAVPIAQAALVAIAGKLALVLILVRIVWGPGDAPVEAGAWIGALGALVVIAGGWIAMRDERLSPATDLTGVPTSERLPVETLPAP